MTPTISLSVTGSVKTACPPPGWGNEAGVGGGRLGVTAGARAQAGGPRRPSCVCRVDTKSTEPRVETFAPGTHPRQFFIFSFLRGRSDGPLRASIDTHRPGCSLSGSLSRQVQKTEAGVAGVWGDGHTGPASRVGSGPPPAALVTWHPQIQGGPSPTGSGGRVRTALGLLIDSATAGSEGRQVEVRSPDIVLLPPPTLGGWVASGPHVAKCQLVRLIRLREGEAKGLCQRYPQSQLKYSEADICRIPDDQSRKCPYSFRHKNTVFGARLTQRNRSGNYEEIYDIAVAIAYLVPIITAIKHTGGLAGCRIRKPGDTRAARLIQTASPERLN